MRFAHFARRANPDLKWLGIAFAGMFGVLGATVQAAEAGPAIKLAAPTSARHAVFGMAGVLSNSSLDRILNPFAARYDDVFLAGGGFQRDLLYPGGGWLLGGEAGLVGRFGEGRSTAEAWAGVYARHPGVTLFDTLTVSPSVTFGLSVATGPTDLERARELAQGGETTLLFYLAPELAFSSPARPNSEIFWRVQHRSGAWHFLGNIRGGVSATMVGFRQRY